LILAGGALALVAFAYAGRLGAQSGGAPAGAGAASPHIGVVNMAYILTYYQKAASFKKEMTDASKPYQDREKGLRGELEAMAKENANLKPGEEARRDELAKKVKQVNRDIEDNGTAAKNLLGKKYDEQLKILYLEIYDATRRYARAHDIDVVLQYADAFTKDDMVNPRRIDRVLATTALFPLYMKEGTDISLEVVNTLNGATGGTAPAAGGSPAGGGAPAAGSAPGGATPQGGR
jgi:Skp family chaperone for outer membrane proteins